VRSPRLRRISRGALKTLLVFIVGLCAAELALRFLLFSDHPAIVARTRALRKPMNFAGRTHDDEYWKLVHAFRGENPSRTVPRDSLLGWVRKDVTPLTYEHRQAADLRGRRPLLVFGDSFANCVIGQEECWEGFMQRSRLDQQYRVVNYVTGGYGFDQTILMMRAALPLYLELDPVVVVTLLIDADLERSTLRCRELPKPHFSVDAGGQLVLDGAVAASWPEFLAAHPIQIKSFLWSFLLHGTDVLPRKWVSRLTHAGAKIAASQELNRELLELAVSELEASGVEYFFLLFHTRTNYQPDASTRWEEPFFIEHLERLDVPYLLSRVLLRRAALERGVSETSFYIKRGPGLNHLTTEGNSIVFEAFTRGLDRQFDRIVELRWLGWDLLERQGQSTSVRWESAGPAGEPSELVLEFGGPGTVRLHYTLAAKATSLRARIRPAGPPGRAQSLRSSSTERPCARRRSLPTVLSCCSRPISGLRARS
jgi:hypothetical protein